MRRRRADAPASVLSCLRPLVLACVGLGGAGQAAGQAAGEALARQVALESSLSVLQTFTDNHQPGDPQGEADSITRMTAGLGWRGRTGALRGFADYALTGLVYARHGERNRLQNALRANVAADLIADRMQLLGSAAIARSAISAFGTQPGGTGDNSSNVTETRTLQLTPTLHGPLGPSVRYKASLAHALTNSADSGQGDSTTTKAALHLEPTERALLGWTLDADLTDSDFALGRRTRSDRLFGGLAADLTAYDVVLSATLGSENTDIVSLDRQRYNTWGLGLRWTPSPVTRVVIDIEQRFFGRSHQVVIEHRLPRTVFALRSARSLSTSGNQLSGAPALDYDSIFNDATLISLQPDPTLRDALARQILQANSGFLRSAATLQDRLELSALWTSPRQSVLMLASRSSSRRVDTQSSAVDDLSGVDRVRSNSLTLNLSHRLTPLASLTLRLNTQRSSGSGTDDLSSRQTQAELQWQTRLAPDSTVGATLRRAHYTTGLRTSDETAITASYGVRF